jgi:hypothetical protein
MGLFEDRMKAVLKSFISYAVRIDFLWSLLNATILRILHYAESERRKQENNRKERVLCEAIETVCPDLVVKSGIFEGMKFPRMEPSNTPLPYLLGSYERELRPVLDRIIIKNYTEVVNIGCAEGYYAVGLALRIPTAKVYAFDINEQAIRQCREMAKLNGVQERVFTGLFCDAKTLSNVPFTEKALIFSDCEGFERELFTKETIDKLSNHDFLIEIHDFLNINISSYIHRLFEGTHEIEIIESLDDIKKAKTYYYREIEQYDLATKKILLGENRPCIMEWFFLESRKGKQFHGGV